MSGGEEDDPRNNIMTNDYALRRGSWTAEEDLALINCVALQGEGKWNSLASHADGQNFAQHLPGRTDNEIKNYWRTRVHKHAKILRCDVNSKQLKDAMRYLWIPRLTERIQANTKTHPIYSASTTTSTMTTQTSLNSVNKDDICTSQLVLTNKYSTNSAISSISDSNNPDCYDPSSENQKQDMFRVEPLGDELDGPLISPSDYFNPEMDYERTIYIG